MIHPTILRCILITLNVLLCAQGFVMKPTVSISRGGRESGAAVTILDMAGEGGKPIKGDSLREATGIRPSLHPTTINAIAEALKFRAMKKPDMPFRVSDTIQPLDVAMTASKIATEAIAKRQQSSDQDGMTLTPQEEQTIAGRVIGVIMRLDDLESTLFEKVSNVGWIAKYNEWSTFGVVKDKDQTDQRIKDDPLLCLSRAECLLAIFINTVEIPQLEEKGETVPDSSRIDFLDDDRTEVLLGGFS